MFRFLFKCFNDRFPAPGVWRWVKEQLASRTRAVGLLCIRFCLPESHSVSTCCPSVLLRSPRRRSFSRSRSRYIRRFFFLDGSSYWGLIKLMYIKLIFKCDWCRIMLTWCVSLCRSLSRDRRRERSLSRDRNHKPSRSFSRSRRYTCSRFKRVKFI